VDVALAVLLILTAIGTLAYWVDFFVHGDVHTVEAEWYVKFERSFPAADGFMAACAVVAAIGLLTDGDYGVAFALVTAGAIIFLGLLDITFNVENRLYRLVRTSVAMRTEAFVNVWTIVLGVTLLVVMVPRV
jgi:hypothetical protein